MPHDAKVVNVVIAGPSDVANERHLVDDVVREWNSINSEDKRIVLMPISWETDASPGMGKRAQEIINEQVVQRGDVLVAIFWTRLGSPTGDSRSGTVEEIEKHLEAGKPAMIYFSAAPVRLDSVDEQQYQALKEFRRECEQRGLIATYESLTEFRDTFARHLAQTIIRSFTVGQETSIGPELLGQNRPLPHLSDEAKQLLVEASLDAHGRILSVPTMGGLHLATHNRNFGQTGDARSEAKWKAALAELVSLSLIESLGSKGEVFAVTDEGFRVADFLKATLAR